VDTPPHGTDLVGRTPVGSFQLHDSVKLERFHPTNSGNE
ncbi:hypothetical protein A2U01_0116467, partial [Trifolium medium]|nr:hypothetical protein [Trifolium medium]